MGVKSANLYKDIWCLCPVVALKKTNKMKRKGQVRIFFLILGLFGLLLVVPGELMDIRWLTYIGGAFFIIGAIGFRFGGGY